MLFIIPPSRNSRLHQLLFTWALNWTFQINGTYYVISKSLNYAKNVVLLLVCANNPGG